MANQRCCLYCGKAGKLTLEHVVPQALGGTQTTKSVCASCNNRILSELDEERACRSPLALVAMSQLHQRTGFVWDLDHRERNLLLEAEADAQSLTVRPQIIFDEDGPKLYGDADEVTTFGWQKFQNVFMQHLFAAFHSFKTTSKRPRLIFEPFAYETFGMYRLPPRVFATKGIAQFSNRMHFRCRYGRNQDRRKVLRHLEQLDPSGSFRGIQVNLGSSLPLLHTRYEPATIVRSLIKLTVNMLRFVCRATSVDREHFTRAVQVVTGETPLPVQRLNDNGFVPAEDIQPLARPKGCHKLRVWHDRDMWHVHFAFFGGCVGAAVRFAGPNRETWNTADITMPLASAKWTIEKSAILQPIPVRIELRDMNKIVPSLNILNARTELVVERVKQTHD